METIYRIAYTLVIAGIIVVLAFLLKEVLKTVRILKENKPQLDKLKEGLDSLKAKATYIKEVKDKTFLDEIILLLAFAKDISRLEKKTGSKSKAIIGAVKKDLPKESLSQLKNKIKAL